MVLETGKNKQQKNISAQSNLPTVLTRKPSTSQPFSLRTAEKINHPHYYHPNHMYTHIHTHIHTHTHICARYIKMQCSEIILNEISARTKKTTVHGRIKIVTEQTTVLKTTCTSMR